ncbi:MAG: hypothetical protein WBD20_10820 [Pirellulaceae bacterium]
MPLRKLWNTIRGNTVSKPVATTTASAQTPSQAQRPAAVESKAPTKPKLSLLDRFSGGPHAVICRLIKGSGASTVLEIGVGNGERALAMTATLVDANPGKTVRYVAIDMFEMADGPITLKDFHKQLRGQNVQPTLVPMDVRGGLNRVSSTIGVVDLVLIAEPNQAIDLAEIKSVLRKVASEGTSVYQLTDDQWEKVELYADTCKVLSPTRRAA